MLGHDDRRRVYAALERAYRRLPEAGIRVMDRDWDSLLVLDACRADLFEEVVGTGAFDDYERVRSLGSMTPEWARRNFRDGAYPDAVNVTANPHVPRVAPDAFHETVAVFEDGFDGNLGTVPPERVARAARHSVEQRPRKRRIVHFVQPHHPFVESPDLERYSNWTVRHVHSEAAIDGVNDPWEALGRGLVSRETVWDGYRANLSYVAGIAVALARALPGKSVVTSDHGNLAGERLWPVPVRGYGHPPGLRHDALREVPWAVLDAEERPTITAGETAAYRADPGVAVDEQLEALGYT